MKTMKRIPNSRDLAWSLISYFADYYEHLKKAPIQALNASQRKDLLRIKAIKAMRANPQ